MASQNYKKDTSKEQTCAKKAALIAFSIYHVYQFSAINFLLWHSIVFDLMNLARAFDPKLRGGIKGTYVGEEYMGKESLY